LARTEAVRRNTVVQVVLGTDTSWTVGCATEATDCPASIQARTAVEGSTNAVVATSEVVASTNLAPTTPVLASTLGFNGLGRVVSTSLPVGNNAVFAITNPTGGACATVGGGGAGGKMHCLRVVVTSAGQVRMCDPAFPIPTLPALPDPQAC
jgi:type IV fimbrial biogenesis protein FimT